MVKSQSFLQDRSICVYLFAFFSVVMVVTNTPSDCFFDSLDVTYAEKRRLGHLKWNFRLIINQSVHQQIVDNNHLMCMVVDIHIPMLPPEHTASRSILTYAFMR